MNNQDLNSIEFFESRERFALSQLFLQKIKPHYESNFDVTLHFTSTFKEKHNPASYDALIYLRDKVTLAIMYKFIIEVKYRDSDYTDLILEKKKYNGLMKEYMSALKYKAGYEDISVLYINFTNKGAYIYNLTNQKLNDFITNNKNKVKKKLVKTTFITNDKEINKDVYYLPKDLAKYYSLNITDDYYLMYNLNKDIKTKETVKLVKTYSIF